MELNTRKSEFLRQHTLCNTVCEIGVQSDIVLPDYCGDIERILKCTLTPRVASKRAENSRIVISGTAFLRMVYLTADGNIGSFETQLPFSKNCEMSSESADATVSVALKCEYVNCRALSARRFEVRASLSARVCAKSRQKLELISDIEGEGVEVKKDRRTAVVPVNCVCENFTVMEEYEVSGAPIGEVLRMNATPIITDSKIVSGKLILKGEIALCIVYMPQESDEVKTLNYTLPINHIMTAPGAEEGDRADIHLDIVRMSAEPSDRAENSEVAIEVFMEACADIKRQDEFEFVCDAYCTDFESDCDSKLLEIVDMEEHISKKYTVSISPDMEFEEIIDVFAEMNSCSAKANEQGEVMADVGLNVAFLLKTLDGMPTVSEKTAQVQFSLGARPEFKGADCDCEVKICSVLVSGNKKGADIEICGECLIKSSEQIACLDRFEINRDAPKQKKRDTAFTLYFAEEGEDIFDIAKRYNTSAAAVMQENELTDSLINVQRAVLIPIV